MTPRPFVLRLSKPVLSSVEGRALRVLGRPRKRRSGQTLRLLVGRVAFLRRLRFLSNVLRTVSTAQAAVRTTFSATLPMNKWARPV